MVLRAKCCDGETGPLPIAIPGGRPRLQEAGLSGESKWLPELPLAREASIVLFCPSRLLQGVVWQGGLRLCKI